VPAESSSDNPGSPSRRIFACYSHADARPVGALVALIRGIGTTMFRDIDSIEPGARWRAEIEQAIELAQLILVFWTQHAAGSPHVKEEYTLGLALHKCVIPVLLDSTPLSPALEGLQGIDLRELWARDSANFQARPILDHFRHRGSQPRESRSTMMILLPSALALKVAIDGVLRPA
jgi:hypothetical protein